METHLKRIHIPKQFANDAGGFRLIHCVPREHIHQSDLHPPTRLRSAFGDLFLANSANEFGPRGKKLPAPGEFF
jgi:hypothetical protein